MSIIHVPVSFSPDKTHFCQATAPFDWRVQLGTLWSDTSGVPVLKICTSVTPITFAAAGGGGGSGIDQLTGDVTAGPGSGSQAATIANDVVTNAKLANMNQALLKGRASGAGSGDPTDLTGTQAAVIIDAMVGDAGAGGTKGQVPAPAAGDAAGKKYLKADGTWFLPGVVLLAVDFVDHTTTGTVEESLYSFSVPANTLTVNGQFLRVTTIWTCAANGNNKRTILKFGATEVLNNQAGSNGQILRICCDIIRTGATTQRSHSFKLATVAVNSGDYQTPGETLSGAITLDVRATTPTASGDITLRMVMVELGTQG